MQLVTIDSREVAGRPGVVTDSGDILDLVAAPSTLDQAQWIPQSVVSVLAAREDGRERVQALLDMAAAADQQSLRDGGVLLPFAGTRLMAPVRRPGLLLVTEKRQAAPGEPDPVAYIKSPNTALGHAQDVRVPWQQADGLCVRPLLGVVLGRPLHQAGVPEAQAAIAAYSLLFDVSRPQPAPGQGASVWRAYLDSKQFPGACPIGPGLITVDEFGDDPLELDFQVNGVSLGAVGTDAAALPALLAGLSMRYGFRPGDVLGVDLGESGEDSRRFQDGDRLHLSLNRAMTLESTLRF